MTESSSREGRKTDFFGYAAKAKASRRERRDQNIRTRRAPFCFETKCVSVLLLFFQPATSRCRRNRRLLAARRMPLDGSRVAESQGRFTETLPKLYRILTVLVSNQRWADNQTQKTIEIRAAKQ